MSFVCTRQLHNTCMIFKSAIENIVKNNSGTTLIVAPIGSGKTRFVHELSLKLDKPIVFFSPLRSIVDELCKYQDVIEYSGDKLDKKGALSLLMRKKVMMVLTPESLNQEAWQLLKNLRPLIVLDEFHLFYTWGHSFREALRTFVEDLYIERFQVVGLSATISDEVKREVVLDHSLNDNDLYYLNLGNFLFQNSPSSHKFLKKNELIYMVIIFFLFTKKRSIVFVKTRRDVLAVRNYLIRFGVNCSTCIGGESREFYKGGDYKEKRVIIATSVLSHGVNLGKIDNVFINFHTDQTLRTQMIGRGGRLGNRYCVFEFRDELVNVKEKIECLIVFLFFQVIRLIYESARRNTTY